MAQRLTKTTLLRFPLLFGGLLLLGGIGFVYRKSFMSDLEEKRNELYNENAEGRLLIEQYKRERRL